MPKPIPTKTIEICEHDACVVRYALTQRLKATQAELVILKITRDRDLTQEERWQLPSTISQLSQDALRDQINPWLALACTIEHLIKEFKVDPSL